MGFRVPVLGAASIAFALLLTACAGGPQPRVEANQQTLRSVQRIDVVTPPDVAQYLVRTGLDGFAPLGGLVGAAAGAEGNDIRSRFVRLANERKLAPYGRLASELADRLSKSGYSTNQIAAPWTIKDGAHYITYKDIKSDADAILLILPKEIGITLDGTFGDLIPYAQVEFVLLKPDRTTFVYQQLYVSGARFKTQGINYLPARTRWKSSDQMLESPQLTLDSLTGAIDDIAAGVVQDLRRPQ